MGELYYCDKKSITNHAKKIGYDYSKNKEIKIANIPPETVYDLYKKLGSSKKVAEQYGCSSTAVVNHLKKNGYVLDANNKLAGISDEEFIHLYDEFKSAQKVGEYLGCSAPAILQRANKIGYDPLSNKNYKLSDIDKQIIIDSYFDKTSNELADEYGVTRGMITKLWYDAGLANKQLKIIKTTEIDLTGQRFGKWTVLSKSDKRSASGSIYWHCKCDCGTEREVNGLSLRNGTSLSCGAHANISKGNEKIKQILTEANIPFEMEKKFKTCIDVNELPFDFYVDNKYLIEYDGIQHFQPTIFDYEYTHRHDRIKNSWCQNNNIPLIRIPYTHFKELCLQDLILSTSNFIKVMPT